MTTTYPALIDPTLPMSAILDLQDDGRDYEGEALQAQADWAEDQVDSWL